MNTPSSARPLALVTGASSGIGAAFARRLARDGYDLVVVARDRDRLRALADALRGDGASVEVFAADLADPRDLDALEGRVRALPALDLLVNNAGFGTLGRFDALDVAREEDVLRVNALAPMRLCRAALPAMVRRGRGGVVNVSSLGGSAPTPWCATYGATKAFLTSFTESLAEELRGTGVRAQALCPGLTRTEFQRRQGAHLDALPPEGTWMRAEDVVDASLAALRRDRAVCVPGWSNRLLLALFAMLPRSIVSRVMARAGRAVSAARHSSGTPAPRGCASKEPRTFP